MRPDLLLLISALLELGAGAALLAVPSSAMKALMGTRLDAAARTLGRIGGAGLFALGIACMLAWRSGPGPATHAVVGGMLAYNILVAIVLAVAALTNRRAGKLLWVAVMLHSLLTIWCVVALR